MAQLLEGLFLYEIILMILGILLFLALLIRFIVKLPSGDQWKWFTVLFLVCVVMIGYPGIMKVKFDNGMIEIERWSRMVEQNPADSAAKAQLKSAIAAVHDEQLTSAENLAKVAVANAVLGDTLKALTYVDRALSDRPDFTEARVLQSAYSTVTVRTDRMIKRLEANPRDAALRSELNQNLRELEAGAGGSPLHLPLAKGYAVLGDSDKALRYSDSVLIRRPASQEALMIQRKFGRR